MSDATVAATTRKRFTSTKRSRRLERGVSCSYEVSGLTRLLSSSRGADVSFGNDATESFSDVADFFSESDAAAAEAS